MRDRVFFDTNILVYAIGQGDERTSVAESLLLKGGFISVQVLNELAAVATRKLGMSWFEVSESLTSIRSLCHPPLSVTVKTHDAALHLATKYGYTIYDSLILASALEARCSIVYTEDLNAGQIIEGSITICNPFGNTGSQE